MRLTINTRECLMMMDKSKLGEGKVEPLTVSIQIPEVSTCVNTLKVQMVGLMKVTEQGKLKVSLRANSRDIAGNLIGAIYVQTRTRHIRHAHTHMRTQTSINTDRHCIPGAT